MRQFLSRPCLKAGIWYQRPKVRRKRYLHFARAPQRDGQLQEVGIASREVKVEKFASAHSISLRTAGPMLMLRAPSHRVHIRSIFLICAFNTARMFLVSTRSSAGLLRQKPVKPLFCLKRYVSFFSTSNSASGSLATLGRLID
jgi:hypothetical protein